jgi:hypothetical protein
MKQRQRAELCQPGINDHVMPLPPVDSRPPNKMQSEQAKSKKEFILLVLSKFNFCLRICFINLVQNSEIFIQQTFSGCRIKKFQE